MQSTKIFEAIKQFFVFEDGDTSDGKIEDEDGREYHGEYEDINAAKLAEYKGIVDNTNNTNKKPVTEPAQFISQITPRGFSSGGSSFSRREDLLIKIIKDSGDRDASRKSALDELIHQATTGADPSGDLIKLYKKLYWTNDDSRIPRNFELPILDALGKFYDEKTMSFVFEVYFRGGNRDFLNHVKRLLLDAMKERSNQEAPHIICKYIRKMPRIYDEYWGKVTFLKQIDIDVLMQGILDPRPKVRNYVKRSLGVLKYCIENQLRNYVLDKSKDKRLIDFGNALIKEIENQIKNHAIIIEVLTRSFGYSGPTRSKLDIEYDLTLRALNLPEGAQYAKLYAIDPKGKHWLQAHWAGNSWGEFHSIDMVGEKRGILQFPLWLNRRNKQVKAYLKYYDDKDGKFIGKSKTFIINSSDALAI